MKYVRIDRLALDKAARQVATIIYHLEPVAGDDPNFEMFWGRAEVEIRAFVDVLLEDLMAGGWTTNLFAHMILDEWRAEKGKTPLVGTMTERLLETLGIKT